MSQPTAAASPAAVTAVHRDCSRVKTTAANTSVENTSSFVDEWMSRNPDRPRRKWPPGTIFCTSLLRPDGIIDPRATDKMMGLPEGTLAANLYKGKVKESQPLLEDDDIKLNDGIELESVGSVTKPHLEAVVIQQSRKWYNSSVWLFFTIGLLCLIIGQNAFLYFAACGYEDGFQTDIAFLKPFIKLHHTRFAGPIHATADGNTMHVPEPALDAKGRRFTGTPSEDIDAAWHDLIYGRYVAFTPAEIKKLNSDTGVPELLPLQKSKYVDEATNTSLVPEAGYYGGPDMLHSLHCLNGIRKHLDMDYYKASMPELSEEYQRMHLNHCLEQLRQAVLCHGDMTPVTLRPIVNQSGQTWALLGETEKMHTCRDGEALAKAWIGRAGYGERVESE
ncbi:hypothetical protein LTR56_019133 [Elasticomyces elasticus]|nr:hypothetical protein LTR56_019133 [Elasticomyces elasticus]KAK3635185.1 hypothetical protein LTR22_019326 [Elasticomyces elasticus]KAK4911506.1 hypothetical protein LTR49_019917 [Elasticomyces elasticus]KAK5751071.1 hypothetical protein LTS12_018881 [Elasticomyces elasticus]